MVKSEPEPKINNFGSATLVLATRPYVVFITRGVFFIVVVVLLLLFCVSPEVNSSVEIGTSSRANSCRASAVPIFCILQSCHLSRASPGLCWQVTSLDSFLPPILGTARGPFQLVPSRASARKQSAKNVK